VGLKIADVSTIAGDPGDDPAGAGFAIETLVGILKGNGVEKAFIASTKGIYQNADSGNEHTLELAQAGELFVPVATVDPRDYLPGEDRIKKLKQRGFSVLRLFNDFQTWPVSMVTVENIFIECDENFMTIVIFGGADGIPTEVLRHAEKVRVPVILLGRNEGTIAEILSCAMRAENIYPEVSTFGAPEYVQLAVKRLGSKRLVFGSGTPLVHYQGALEPLMAAKIADIDRNRIAHENVMRILRDAR